eukprot:TRINITY_DN111404_c0_g1_i1.p1 TRINITY_DN111404_c0_g1~~TRINITY_DN111404_c0_g1_i1.p1  ORF type:complete len:234 (+),score=33.14 TRINITY_DN111404_c0_g1_i1:64-765(+)
MNARASSDVDAAEVQLSCMDGTVIILNMKGEETVQQLIGRAAEKINTPAAALKILCGESVAKVDACIASLRDMALSLIVVGDRLFEFTGRQSLNEHSGTSYTKRLLLRADNTCLTVEVEHFADVDDREGSLSYFIQSGTYEMEVPQPGKVHGTAKCSWSASCSSKFNYQGTSSPPVDEQTMLWEVDSMSEESVLYLDEEMYVAGRYSDKASMSDPTLGVQCPSWPPLHSPSLH